MKSPRKYAKGRVFGSFGEYLRHITVGGYVWTYHKAIHGHVALNMPLKGALLGVASGAIRYADVSVEWQLWRRDWPEADETEARTFDRQRNRENMREIRRLLDVTLPGMRQWRVKFGPAADIFEEDLIASPPF